jgi:hypothetical protein
MKNTLIVFTLCAMLFAPSVFAQFKLTETATMDSAKTLSSVVDLGGYTIAAIKFPTVFQGTSVTILTSATSDSASFRTFQYKGTDVTVTASDNKTNSTEPAMVWGLLRYVRFLSDSAQTASGRVLTVYKTKLN